ncbi:hypothetical protein [Haloprofundus salilacus]|uniref:hypothetical protein n=1 Tax=Haloprofundus salilacus TaxID=2876190 RepID=UPI001CC9AFD6|nr:hypothetical protein [Haloprofundus salilacus]
MDVTRNGTLGLGMMVAGTLGFVPTALPSSTFAGVVGGIILVVAAALLTAGTYLIGTDVTGRAV